ncbi:MAG TPA: sigma-70 family RNA polymerase sigma factor [Ktedonobacteraceae bacterium]|nr:sigma-70 family RNA polymerase sigma factor [Ktedonobacteraceae bacterium]
MQDANIDIIHGPPEDAIYHRFAPKVLQYLLEQLNSPEDAEDLLLEVFIVAFNYTTLEQLSPERQLAWLRRVARNKVIDRYRRNALITFLPLDQALAQEDHERSPEQHAEWRESLQMLYSAFHQLSSLQQELLLLRYRRELRLEEIGKLIGKSEGAVRKLLARTLQKLQRMYARMEKEGWQ